MDKITYIEVCTIRNRKNDIGVTMPNSNRIFVTYIFQRGPIFNGLIRAIYTIIRMEF